MNEWMNGLLWLASSSQYFFPGLSFFWSVSLQPQAQSLEQGFDPRPTVSTSLENLLEKKICELQPRLESQGMGPTHLCFIKPSRRLLCTLKFENHC